MLGRFWEFLDVFTHSVSPYYLTPIRDPMHEAIMDSYKFTPHQQEMRERLIGQALVGLLSGPEPSISVPVDRVADHAINLADAIIRKMEEEMPIPADQLNEPAAPVAISAVDIGNATNTTLEVFGASRDSVVGQVIGYMGELLLVKLAGVDRWNAARGSSNAVINDPEPQTAQFPYRELDLAALELARMHTLEAHPQHRAQLQAQIIELVDRYRKMAPAPDLTANGRLMKLYAMLNVGNFDAAKTAIRDLKAIKYVHGPKG